MNSSPIIFAFSFRFTDSSKFSHEPFLSVGNDEVYVEFFEGFTDLFWFAFPHKTMVNIDRS